MKFNNLITPAILSCVLPFAFSANALDAAPENTADYNFATIKAGLVQPTSLGGNSGLNTGDTTYAAGALVGRKFMDMFSVDLEYMYRGKNTADSYNAREVPRDNQNSWSMKSDTFMLNVSADLIQDAKIRPYVRLGAGISRNQSYDYTSTAIDSSVNNGAPVVSRYSGKTVNKFAWQAGLGVNLKTTEMFDTQLEYMFVNRGKVETKSGYVDSDGEIFSTPAIHGKLKEHVITIGFKIKF